MLPFVWGPLSFEYTVDMLFVFNQKTNRPLYPLIRGP